MRLIIQPNYDRVSQWTAAYVAMRLSKFKPTAERPHFILGLPTGSSPMGAYKELARLNKEGKISFKNVISFNMDEYVGLPEGHPESYRAFMREHLFQHIDIPAAQTNILNGNAKDLEEECRSYEEKIKQCGGIDLFLGGIGPDGHIAFNEPGSSLSSRTRIKTLRTDTIIANSRFFGGDVAKVPKTALTVGVGTVMEAKEVLVIISGHSKAHALAQAVEHGVNHMWTVSALQLHPKGLIVCDEESCAEIKLGTFRYFQDIESPNIDPKKIFPAF